MTFGHVKVSDALFPSRFGLHFLGFNKQLQVFYLSQGAWFKCNFIQATKTLLGPLDHGGPQVVVCRPVPSKEM